MELMNDTSDLLSIEKLTNTVQQLSLATDIDAVMKIVRSVARELTGADGATFVLKDDNMCYYADEDAISPLWKGSRFPIKICISGWAMIHKKPAIVPDIYQDNRIPIDAYKPTFVKSLVTVPIRRVAPIGAIGNYWADLHEPTDEEITLLQALADITAVSIENINIRTKLEEKLSERDLMLSQLKKQKSQLEEFNHIISHNLRAPLTNLSLLNNMINKKPEIEQKLLFIDKQKQVIDSLLNTFDELVDAAQVKTNFDIEKDYIEIEDCVLKIITLLQGDIIENKVKISYDFSSVKSVYYPREYFESILINLISNSIKYSSPERIPEIHIKSWKAENWVWLEVKDNGLGIDLEQHGNDIFKLHKTFHDNPKAKGFGLFITKTQVEAMKGSISVESKVDEGSKFTIQLSKVKTQ